MCRAMRGVISSQTPSATTTHRPRPERNAGTAETEDYITTKPLRIVNRVEGWVPSRALNLNCRLTTVTNETTVTRHR